MVFICYILSNSVNVLIEKCNKLVSLMEILTGLIPDCNYMHDLYYSKWYCM